METIARGEETLTAQKTFFRFNSMASTTSKVVFSSMASTTSKVVFVSATSRRSRRRPAADLSHPTAG